MLKQKGLTFHNIIAAGDIEISRSCSTCVHIYMFCPSWFYHDLVLVDFTHIFQDYFTSTGTMVIALAPVKQSWRI